MKVPSFRLVEYAIAAAIVVLVVVLLLPFLIPEQPAYFTVCGTNLSGLGKAILIYSNDFRGEYPTPDKWCDLLIECDITEKQFICASALRKGDKGRCHYAINPECGPNSPNDVVLLFETKGGWNQFGGRELLSLENHEIFGFCTILLNNNEVEYIRNPEDLDKLKWKCAVKE